MEDKELFDSIIDVPTDSQNLVQPTLYNNVPVEPEQNEMEVIGFSEPMEVPVLDEQPNLNENNSYMADTVNAVSNAEPEVIDFDSESKVEQVNTQGKVVNHQLLESLNKDTNNLVNPSMIVNPFGKQEETKTTTPIEEPKVDYDEIKTKKGYVFMAIIFLIIIVFIIFLPQIMSFIGI